MPLRRARALPRQPEGSAASAPVINICGQAHNPSAPDYNASSLGAWTQTSSSSAGYQRPSTYSCNTARCNSYRSLTTCRSRRLPLLDRGAGRSAPGASVTVAAIVSVSVTIVSATISVTIVIDGVAANGIPGAGDISRRACRDIPGGISRRACGDISRGAAAAPSGSLCAAWQGTRQTAAHRRTTHRRTAHRRTAHRRTAHRRRRWWAKGEMHPTLRTLMREDRQRSISGVSSVAPCALPVQGFTQLRPLSRRRAGGR